MKKLLHHTALIITLLASLVFGALGQPTKLYAATEAIYSGSNVVSANLTLSGTDANGLNAGLEGGSYNVIVKNSAGNTLVSGMASSGTQKWGLQLLAPTTFTGGGAGTVK